MHWRNAGEPGALDDPVRRVEIDSLIDSVKDHPALYDYYVADELSAAVFPTLARVVAHIRERDPAHQAHINLFPTYASVVALGTAGDTETAYREHLRQFVEVVKPDLISYDHYPFRKTHDSGDYFLNLALAREAALAGGVPFINVVQAVALSPESRVPTAGEGRFQAYTTLAYGGQGISHFTYWPYSEFRGGIAEFDDREFDENEPTTITTSATCGFRRSIRRRCRYSTNCATRRRLPPANGTMSSIPPRSTGEKFWPNSPTGICPKAIGSASPGTVRRMSARIVGRPVRSRR